MAIDRRDLLLMATGSAAGLLLSPLPWKFLDDLAIDTQHSRLAPEPPRGEVTHRLTACGLCPAGCALKVRCVGGRPVSVTGVRSNPVSRGALCATGLAAHHLLAHPARLAATRRVVWQGSRAETGPARLEEIVADAVGAIRETRAAVPVAWLDLRPGRTATTHARRLLASLPGSVVATPPRADATLAALSARLGAGAGPLGADLASVHTVAGFGAPLLEGWGAPAHAATLVARTPRARVLAAEARRSPTAEGADLWIPLREGGAAALALGLANVLLHARLVPEDVRRRAEDLDAFVALATRFDPSTVEGLAGVPPERLVAMAHALADGPSLVLGGRAPGAEPLAEEAEGAIAALDLLLDSFGRSVIPRRALPDADPSGPLAPELPLASIADGSIAVLVIDAAPGESLAWGAVAPKLAPGARVVSLSPWLHGLAERAHWAAPGPAPLECWDEALPAAGAPAASWALAEPVVAPPEGVVAPHAFLSALLAGAGAAPPPFEGAEALLKRRAAAIAAERRGRVFAPAARAAGVGNGDALFAALRAGAVWVDDPLPPPRTPPRFRFFVSPDEAERLAACASRPCPATSASAPLGYVGAAGGVPQPAILGKLGRETGLRATVNSMKEA